MKSVPIDELNPPKEPRMQRVQNVVQAFLSQPSDRQKRLAAIEKALEMNAKQRQSETSKQQTWLTRESATNTENRLKNLAR